MGILDVIKSLRELESRVSQLEEQLNARNCTCKESNPVKLLIIPGEEKDEIYRCEYGDEPCIEEEIKLNPYDPEEDFDLDGADNNEFFNGEGYAPRIIRFQDWEVGKVYRDIERNGFIFEYSIDEFGKVFHRIYSIWEESKLTYNGLISVNWEEVK